MTDVVFKAMIFARNAHVDQRRKYTDAPYFDHLAEVVGISASVGIQGGGLAVAWLHDVVEDQNYTVEQIADSFGRDIADSVGRLSDLEEGNRTQRKHLSRLRLAGAPSWVQTIKLADLISNTSSIVQFDPKFAEVYLAEKRALLEVMNQGDPRLYAWATELVKAA